MFGRVYSARHRKSNRIVAVKELKCNVDAGETRVQFEREVQMLATIRHPAVLSLVGFTEFVNDGDHGRAILMPFMSRGSLADVLVPEYAYANPEEWTPTRKLIILLGIASGMMFMHEHRFIHRDLKPENVLLDCSFEAQISDFGLSKSVPAGQSPHQSMHGGTPLFIAPEIHSGAPFGFKADVYAFGILMYIVVPGVAALFYHSFDGKRGVGKGHLRFPEADFDIRFGQPERALGASDYLISHDGVHGKITHRDHKQKSREHEK
jgi:serine/threonine protein kinase